MVITTRRFFWRPAGSSDPSGFLFGATGLVSPQPRVVIRAAATPSSNGGATGDMKLIFFTSAAGAGYFAHQRKVFPGAMFASRPLLVLLVDRTVPSESNLDRQDPLGTLALGEFGDDTVHACILSLDDIRWLRSRCHSISRPRADNSKPK